MIDRFALDRIPLWGIFILMVFTILISIRAGYFWGARVRRDSGAEKAGVVGSVVPAILGLLAFIIAFCFNLATVTFNDRKQLMLKEVNSIQTTYLRAGLIPEPQRSRVRELLKEYVDLRVELRRQSPARLKEFLSRAEEIQKELWPLAASLTETDKIPVTYALFINSLNEMIDLQTSRLTAALQFRIPEIVLIVIYFLSVVSMLVVGCFFGLSGTRYRLVNLTLALTFSSVIWLIADLDRAAQGTILIPGGPMLELQQKLGK